MTRHTLTIWDGTRTDARDPQANAIAHHAYQQALRMGQRNDPDHTPPTPPCGF